MSLSVKHSVHAYMHVCGNVQHLPTARQHIEYDCNCPGNQKKPPSSMLYRSRVVLTSGLIRATCEEDAHLASAMIVQSDVETRLERSEFMEDMRS